jgi:ATP sulfurylase
VNSSARIKRYKPTQLVELSDREIVRMLRRGQDPARGLNRFEVAEILRRALEKIAQRPEMLRALARAVAARRESIDAQRAVRDGLPRKDFESANAAAELY